MYPAERVEHVFRDVLRMNTVNGIAYVLPCGHNKTKCNQDKHRDGVMQSKDGAVNVQVADFDEGFQPAKNVQHL